MSIKANTGTVSDILSGLRKGFQYLYKTNEDGTQEPFRAELYSSSQMDRHGKLIAATHTLLQHKVPDSLLKRLEDNERKLVEVRNVLVESIRSGKTISPAAEWLLDNFYLIEEQVVLARKHLPKGYSEQLPYLASGNSQGMPRVYDIVLEIIAHSDGRVDVKNLSSFIAAYQSETILTLGELWAIPIMLRLAVIENLRRVCSKIALDMIDNDLADYWADKMMTTVKETPGNLILVIADMARSKPVLDSPFVAAFTRKLQGLGPALALPLAWMEEQLTAIGLSSSDLVLQESQKQAADQVSVRNSIGTLRFIGSNNWSEFVETLSSVEQVLRKDITGVYSLMDFATRDRYRHVIENIAKTSALTETEVAEKVLSLTKELKEQKDWSRCAHVGYFLVDKGLKLTEQVCGKQPASREKLSRLYAKMPVQLYLSAIILLTGLITVAMWYLGFRHGTSSIKLNLLVILLFMSGAAQLAVSLVNWIATIWVQPRLLPRMDYSKNIPAECRTLVVIPTMLSSMAYIEELVEALEIRYLANRESNLHFGLLTDFTDALSEHMPEDESLLLFAGNQIEALNQKYSPEEKDIFFLFHRPRKWNPKEGKWMGYERKRGKLASLNALLRGRRKDDFISIVGQQRLLERVKYVITLDSDTQLPREAAWKIIATMAHPLNRAIYNPKLRRVTEGYGILQPRVASAIPKGATSLYLRMHGNAAGIDPYTQASSDVYQDLFGEGSFIGKGIYDVDIFEQVFHGVFQENRILSHDLLEGCYARSGMLSDVFLYEESPTQYAADIKRHHRWIRGDWQIGAWMLPFVTKANGKLRTNKLSLLSRWKIMDNLRRSFLPLALLLLLLLGWTVLPYAWFWTLAVTLFITLPVMVGAGWHLMHKPKDINLKAHLSEVGISVRDILLRFIFGIAVMPYEAFKYTDAIIRTNWRMAISRRNLLQWVPSADDSNNVKHNIGAANSSMWISPCISLVGVSLILSIHPSAIFVAAPILLLWLLAPTLAFVISLPEAEQDPGLDYGQYMFLHKTARKTWSYFETFVTEADHWLPPDNFQEEPVTVLAHRTSPTNMGLALLANLTAYDFGYITGKTFVDRSRNTLDSMALLEKYRGHFYNWYDTLTLAPLPPRYVSTVDSGNLVGHLLTLKQGIIAMPYKPIFEASNFEGINSCARVVKEYFKTSQKELLNRIIALTKVSELPDSMISIKRILDELVDLSDELLSKQTDQNEKAQAWVMRLVSQIKSNFDDLLYVAPWITLLPISEKYQEMSALDHIPSYASIEIICEQHIKQMQAYQAEPAEAVWWKQLKGKLEEGIQHAKEIRTQLDKLAYQCEDFSTVDYDFIFDKSSSLLRIGYNVEEQRRDDSFYDLLASEARLGIFAGIAQGKLPQECWFALGRLLTNSGSDPILLSWSGSMFEYLMPQLVMPAYENTLLYQTNKATVKRQIEYGAKRNVPWGISESAYNAFDTLLNYQYRAFGVPGLGLKRGLEEDLVIAPYASMMALMVLPERACSNLQLLAREGFEGEHGFYEAIDYTPGRLPRDKNHEVIRSFMVHHQGMGFLSLSYLLLKKPMQQRFITEPRFQATLLLLQERIPRATVFYAHTAELIQKNTVTTAVSIRKITNANTPIPEVQLLSNGRYQVMITNSGGGYSRWKDLSLTRWREDGTKDGYGIFCYIKDVDSNVFWSNTHQPTLKVPKNYEVLFSQGHVEFSRTDQGFVTKTEIVISPEDDIEMRRVRITNKSSVAKVLEVTSYAEVVMASQASDEAHPAFSNLFVQTEIHPQHQAILGTRRPRSQDEVPPWVFHLMDIQGVALETISYETDRMEFIGRGRTIEDPKAMHVSALSGSEGAVLDPILAIRHRFTIKANQTVTIDMVYGISDTKEACKSIIHKYKDQHLRRRAIELSWTHNQVLLRQLNATEADVQLFNRLAASVIFANPSLRADAAIINNNFRGQSGLWSHSVSGDLPIILLHIHDPENIEIVRQMVQAHAYWRLKGLAVDLIIWNEDHGSYRQILQDEISGMVNTEMGVHTTYSKPGSIFVKSTDQISPEDRILFESVARVIIDDNKGTLAEQVDRIRNDKVLPGLLEKPLLPTIAYKEYPLLLPDNLLYFNGRGGFSKEDKTYKIITDRNDNTPVPWVNIIANPDFGTVVSESASAYTWAVNAHEYRLTPWSNDPVSDIGGEAFYIRDEVTGDFWSPAPFPSKGNSPYVTTHGFGYSTFEHSEQGIHSEMTLFVHQELPLKFVSLKMKNYSGKERKLTATGFMEMILGDVRSKTNMHILSELDATTGALFFRNRYNSAFADQVTFFSVNGTDVSFTTDRSEFIGRNRNLKDPKALYQKKLSGRVGAGRDTCAALQSRFDLLNGEEREIIFLLGSVTNAATAQRYVQEFKATEAVASSLENVKDYWHEKVETVQVSTPDPALDLLSNGWLLYQTMACRIFARSGFYQSGGAFGFRDQLQDVLAVLYAAPALAKEQLLISASRQFEEGDVQHWWHPPEGRGVRTRCSDDLLWLPFVTAKYMEVTGDTAILQATAGFLESRKLHPGEDSLYDLPKISAQRATLYEHCVRSIRHSLVFGKHGLPLIGSGDWNDGMDQVGHLGKGESVWLAFFLYDVLTQFEKVAIGFGDENFAATCKTEAAKLQSNIEASAWDGEWYLRAWFDNGTPLGTHTNQECRIDAIAQSWSVLSDAGSEERKKQAMASLDKYLVRRDLKLIQLLEPAFDKSDLNPGYIKGYVPGVRENGGQYSHAAIWALMAFAKMGARDKVYELFSMVQPINHSLDATAREIYKVEPYVMAADVYANESHKGRGGWTWYTGSAGWMYQFLLSALIGMEREGDTLKFKPCFPLDWPSVEIKYQFGKSLYSITVKQIATGTSNWQTEIENGEGNAIKLIDDGMQHTIAVNCAI